MDEVEATEAAPEETALPVEDVEQVHDHAPEEDADLPVIEAEIDADTVMLGDIAVPRAALMAMSDDDLRGIVRTVKVNGEDVEVSLFDSLQAVSKAGGADAKMREAAHQRKQAEQALARVLEDPMGAIESIAQMKGLSIEAARGVLENAMLERFEYEALDPAERAKKDARSELERKARSFDEAEKRRATAAETAAHQENVTTMRGQLDAALERAGATGDTHVFQRAVTIMSGLINANGEVPAGELAAAMDKAATQAQAEVAGIGAGLLGGDADAVYDRLPPAIRKAVARRYASEVKKTTPGARRVAGTAPPVKVDRKETVDEWRSRLERMDAEA